LLLLDQQVLIRKGLKLFDNNSLPFNLAWL